MTYTTHYSLKKPGLDDPVAVGDLNDNADAIDQAIFDASQSGGSATGMIEQASESTATSAHPYAIGEHFVYDSKLYKATAAIAIGDTITPGTNCEESPVASELEGKKDLQSPVADPSASGTALSFIDSISQNAEGVITPTKKNVQLDDTPTEDSNNPVKSGGVFSALGDKIPASAKGAANGVASLDANAKVPAAQLLMDSALSDSSENPVQNKAVSAKMKSTTQADQAYHMGFYIDADGDLCQA